MAAAGGCSPTVDLKLEVSAAMRNDFMRKGRRARARYHRVRVAHLWASTIFASENTIRYRVITKRDFDMAAGPVSSFGSGSVGA